MRWGGVTSMTEPNSNRGFLTAKEVTCHIPRPNCGSRLGPCPSPLAAVAVYAWPHTFRRANEGSRRREELMIEQTETT